ncbi:MAG: metal ABC transporter solute-binding protein, Zn/Mn family [Rickettsiales bacterium]
MLLTSQAAFAGALFPNVVVTVAPLKPYVDEILRGRGESSNLLRPGQEPHDFALSPSQAEILEKADIVVVPDLGINPFMKRLLAGKRQILVIELSGLEGADALPYAAENPWLVAMKAAQKSEPEKKAARKRDAKDEKKQEVHLPPIDPHLWLDPERMAAMAVPLAEAIAEKTPESHGVLVMNAKMLALHLRKDVIPQLRAMMKENAREQTAVGRKEIPFITYHAAYQYFLQRFGLTHYGEITTRPEEMMGAQTTATLLRGAPELHVRCLIGEDNLGLMKRLAQMTKARVVLLSPEQLVERREVDALEWMKNDYDRFLYVTAKTFSGCL